MKKALFYAFASLLILSGCNHVRCIKTIDNLKTGIQGEATTRARYAAFAVKAKSERHYSIAKLFEATSISEGIHEVNQRKVLKSLGEKMEVFKPEIVVKTTIENLQVAIDGETYVTKTLYLLFFRDTKSENAEMAETSFTWVINSELKHLFYFQNALSAIENSTEKNLPIYYVVCPLCGNIYEYTDVEVKCASCGTPKRKFLKI